jgi:hypothetical protein
LVAELVNADLISTTAIAAAFVGFIGKNYLTACRIWHFWKLQIEKRDLSHELRIGLPDCPPLLY